MKESEIIQRFFDRSLNRPDIELGIGDDAAVINIPPGHQLVISTDTLLAGVHFFSDQNPYEIAYKALAVNLSDIAAMGAEPKIFSLSLTLPDISESWLTSFSDGLFNLVDQYQLGLIGGDLTKGPLAITITIQGLIPDGQFITRAGSKPGDKIFVTGTLGDAGLVLDLLKDSSDQVVETLRHRLVMPEPRVALGIRLRDYANSMIDLSDGLALDLSRILSASKVGARLKLENLPLSQSMKQLTSTASAIEYALSSGDDYELCFSVGEKFISNINSLGSELNIPITYIVDISEQQGLKLIDKNNEVVENMYKGHDHFE